MNLVVVCWKWRAAPQYRSKFEAEHVNTLQRMVARNLKLPHRFVCITDDPKGVECKTIKLWSEPHVPLPPDRPNCYRRLRLWAADAAKLVGGERILSLDLDMVITGDITPLVDRPEPLVIWGDTAKGTPYNGSMWLLTAGARRQVWDCFDPHHSPGVGRRLGYIGSDQAWLGACLGPHEPKWTARDGVYSFRNQIEPPRGTGRLPEGARVVAFHGRHDPWRPEVQARYPWIKDHYHP